jgi:hypothetical protein
MVGGSHTSGPGAVDPSTSAKESPETLLAMIIVIVVPAIGSPHFIAHATCPP